MIVEATESIQDEHLELIGILNDDSKIVLNEETVEIESIYIFFCIDRNTDFRSKRHLRNSCT